MRDSKTGAEQHTVCVDALVSSCQGCAELGRTESSVIVVQLSCAAHPPSLPADLLESFEVPFLNGVALILSKVPCLILCTAERGQWRARSHLLDCIPPLAYLISLSSPAFGVSALRCRFARACRGLAPPGTLHTTLHIALAMSALGAHTVVGSSWKDSIGTETQAITYLLSINTAIGSTPQ